MAQYKGINHLALVTSDMDMTIRFWRDLLGMRLVAGLGDGTYRHYFFEISTEDMIAFFEWPGAEKPELKDHGVPVDGPAIFDHVAIGVSAMEDLIELRRKITAAGLWVSEIIDHGFILSIYAFDPNRIPIEFSWQVPEVDVRSHPKMKDKSPSKTAIEGPEPQPGKWPSPDALPQDEDDTDVYPGEGIVFKEE